jgi:CheY-like chemotaxis protein
VNRILIVDDDESVRKSLVRALGARGLQVTSAEDGIEALQKTVANPPSVIITDLQLPLLSGADVVRMLREDAMLARIPVIALSATPDETTRYLFDQVLTKPCSIDALMQAIAEVTKAKPFPQRQ